MSSTKIPRRSDSDSCGKIVSAKVTLTEEECYGSIADLYDLIAAKLGWEPQKISYDCRKICVTNPVMNQIFAYYTTEQKADKIAIAHLWVVLGPKANIPGNDYRVDIQKGFIREGAL